MLPTVLILRLSSQVMSALMGGMAVFCLYYAARIPDSHDLILHLLLDALKWGGAATVIVYCQGKYLDDK